MKNTSPSHTTMCQHSTAARWRNILGHVPLLPCYLKGNTVNTIPYKKRVQEKEGAGIQGKRSCSSSAPARGSSLKNGRARAMNVMDIGQWNLSPDIVSDIVHDIECNMTTISKLQTTISYFRMDLLCWIRYRS